MWKTAVFLAVLLVLDAAVRGGDSQGVCDSKLAVTSQIRVAMHQELSAQGQQLSALLGQLSASSAFLLPAPSVTLVPDANLQSASAIAASYDVVWLGGTTEISSQNALSVAAATAIRDFVLQGGGLISTFGLEHGFAGSAALAALQPVLPVTFTTPLPSPAVLTSNCHTPSNDIRVTREAAAAGTDMGECMPSFFLSSSMFGFQLGGLAANATSMFSASQLTGCIPATVNTAQGNSTVATPIEQVPALADQLAVTLEPGSGRSVYFGFAYTGSFFTYSQALQQITPPIRLASNAMKWTSKATQLCSFKYCSNGGVCSAPDTCDCSGVPYEGPQCNTFVPTTGAATTASASGAVVTAGPFAGGIFICLVAIMLVGAMW